MDPPTKALFRGVWDLVLVPRKGKTASRETPGYLGDRLRAHKGHGTSQLVAQNIFHFGKKRKNGPNIASFNGHAHVICWSYEKSNCTCGFLVKFWYKNILRLSPNSK